MLVVFLVDTKIIFSYNFGALLTHTWQRPLSYRNQSINLLCISVDWFLYDRDLRHERIKSLRKFTTIRSKTLFQGNYFSWKGSLKMTLCEIFLLTSSEIRWKLWKNADSVLSKMLAKLSTKYQITGKLVEVANMACLKLVSAIFYQIFIFSPNDSPSKTMKNVFYFI